MTDNAEDRAETMEVEDDKRSSARVLEEIEKAKRSLNDWHGLCDNIDDIYARKDSYVESDWLDPDYDLFWASSEIMKPAVYARIPKPVVSPLFKDRRALQNTTAELLERSVTSAFYRTNLDEAMCCTRDDLIFYNRGQQWVTYETDEKGGGKRICVEHLDRKDFLHPPARKWSDVPWVARRAWMWPSAANDRFQEHLPADSKDVLENAPTCSGEGENKENNGKIGIWEVWHKEDDRVYWVAEGISVILDEGEPHLKLRGFFPCPRPAYGTLKPRSLVPVPDYVRYAGHFKKINSLTRRIYDLLDMVRMKGLIPSGGDAADAVAQLIKDDSNSSMLIEVPGAALLASGGAASFVQWLPLADIATAIQGLIEARRELFSDYDRLSGISDIMRGETDADETLGAQQLKSQYGSVRVREKVEELQRIARDVTEIASEIMSDEFDKETLLDMSQMEIPTKAEVKAKVSEIEKAAKAELKELGEKAKQMAHMAQQQGQQIDPAQAQQQLQQAQQQIVGKYGPLLQQASDQVPIEDVMKLLRDDKARSFAFEIETDSTVLTDELQEKASRNEFLTVFSGAQAGLASMAAMGPAGAKLAGEILKFVLQTYRVGRSLNSVIDEFIDAAPQMAAAAANNGGEEANQAIAEANKKLADAEMEKAKAQTVKVQNDAAAKQQDLQAKISQLQLDGQEKQFKASVEAETLRGKLAEQDAKINLMQAQTAEILNTIGLDVRKQDLEEYKAATDTQFKANDQAMSVEDQQRQAVESERNAAMDDRQQTHAEQQGERAESRADRQQEFSEQSSDRQMTLAERQAAKDPVG